MSNMQLINLFLAWLFFGLLGAYLAKKKGYSPILWFCLGPILGIIGILVLFLLPKPRRKSASPHAAVPKVLAPAAFHEAWTKFWYYLDANRAQQGPLEFPDFADSMKKDAFNEDSFVWGEGMQEWKRLKDLPDVLQEIENNLPKRHLPSSKAALKH